MKISPSETINLPDWSQWGKKMTTLSLSAIRKFSSFERPRRFPKLPALAARIFGHLPQDPELALQFILHSHKTREGLPVIPRITLTGLAYN